MLIVAITAVAAAGTAVTAKACVDLIGGQVLDAVKTHRMAKVQRELETRLITREAA